MASPSISITIILSEIILIETLIIIGVSTYLIIKTKKKNERLKQLFNDFKANKDNRVKSISDEATKPDNVNEEEFNELIHSIANSECDLYKNIINVYSKNDLDGIEPLSGEFKKIYLPIFASIHKDNIDINANIETSSNIDVDTAIDELLSDDGDINDFEDDNTEPNDPHLDLSNTADSELVDDSDLVVDNEGIAEIPSELLDKTPELSEDENQKKSSTVNNEQEENKTQ